MTSILMAIFVAILNQSMVASAVIVCVLLARCLLKSAPKRFSYALWAVVLFRLICPFSFESAHSLIPLSRAPLSQDSFFVTDTQGAGVTTGQADPNSNTNQATTPDGLPLGDITESPTLPNHATTPKDDMLGHLTPQTDFTANQTEDMLNAQHPTGSDTATWSTWFVLAGYVWLGGVLVLGAYSLCNLIGLRKKLRGATLCARGVYTSPAIDTAFVFGLRHPKIYIASHLLGAEKDYILLHERTHLRRGDHIVKLIAFATLCIHWFNPLAWVAFCLSGKDMEMSCDEAVIRTLGAGVKQSYSASLLSLATGRRILGGTSLGFGAGDTKSRIKNVLSYRKPTLWVVLLSIFLLASVLLASLFTAQPSGNGNESDITNLPDNTQVQSSAPQSDTTQSDATTSTPVQSETPIQVVQLQEPTMTYIPPSEQGIMLFSASMNDALSAIPSMLMEPMGQETASAWMQNAIATSDENPTVLNTSNLYAFVRAFDISDELVRDYFVGQREYLPAEYCLTDEDIEVLLSGDTATVATRFVNPYGYADGDNVYSPRWIYEHSVADYIAHGLPLDIMAEKLTTISMTINMGINLNGKYAIDQKLQTIAQVQRLQAEGTAFALLPPLKDATKQYTDIFADTPQTESVLGIVKDGKKYTATWLAQQDVSVYEQVGITADELGALLDELSAYQETYEYGIMQSICNKID